jgi:hypothetical protein
MWQPANQDNDKIQMETKTRFLKINLPFLNYLREVINDFKFNLFFCLSFVFNCISSAGSTSGTTTAQNYFNNSSKLFEKACSIKENNCMNLQMYIVILRSCFKKPMFFLIFGKTKVYQSSIFIPRTFHCHIFYENEMLKRNTVILIQRLIPFKVKVMLI